jgi:hypothetical protein
LAVLLEKPILRLPRRGNGMEWLLGFLGRVDKRWGGRGLGLLAAGFVAGASVGLSTFGVYVYQFAKWQADALLASANKRAETADQKSADANKRASEATMALEEQKAKYEEELSSLKTQVQALKKNAALQKQKVAKRPKSQILNDLFGDEEWFIIGHNRRILVDRRYMIIATPSGRFTTGGLLGSTPSCTLTVANVDTNEENEFNFVEGRSGVLSLGETKITLILLSATNVGGKSEVCAFQYRQ